MIGAGDRLGSNYVVGEVIGRGAMGTVHEGRHLTTEARVAIKVLHPHLASDIDVVGRFVKERQALERVNHPNVVRVRDLVVDGGLIGIVMEHVDGPDLSELRKVRFLHSVQVIDLASQLAWGLDDIHAARVVHRDLKPANVMIVGGGQALIPKITDFGIAHLASDRREVTTRLIGTPRYLAPETMQEDGVIGPAVDVYALGVMLFELLTGAPPFTGDNSVAILQAHWKERPPRIGDVPDELAELVDRMLAKQPECRPPAREVAAVLADLRSAIDPEATPTRVEPLDRLGSAIPREATAFVKLARAAADRRDADGDAPSALPSFDGYATTDHESDGPGSFTAADARIARARAEASARATTVPAVPRWGRPAVATALAAAGIALLVVLSQLAGVLPVVGGDRADSPPASSVAPAAALTVDTTVVEPVSHGSAVLGVELGPGTLSDPDSTVVTGRTSARP